MKDIKQSAVETIESTQREILLIKAKQKPLRKQISALDSDISKAEERLRKSQEILATFKAEPKITDHAVIRYLERVHNFSFEEIKSDLLSENVVFAIKSGAKAVKKDGYNLVIKGNSVVTVT